MNANPQSGKRAWDTIDRVFAPKGWHTPDSFAAREAGWNKANRLQPTLPAGHRKVWRPDHDRAANRSLAERRNVSPKDQQGDTIAVPERTDVFNWVRFNMAMITWQLGFEAAKLSAMTTRDDGAILKGRYKEATALFLRVAPAIGFKVNHNHA